MCVFIIIIITLLLLLLLLYCYYTLDNEINTILSSHSNPNVVMKNILYEYKKLKESNDRYRKHNSNLQTEITRLQTEVRINRQQIQEHLRSGEISQIDLLELKKKNENLVSNLIIMNNYNYKRTMLLNGVFI